MSMFTNAKKANEEVLLLHNLQLNSYTKIRQLRSKLKLYDFNSGNTVPISITKAKYKNTEQKLLELEKGKFEAKKGKKIVQLL